MKFFSMQDISLPAVEIPDELGRALLKYSVEAGADLDPFVDGTLSFAQCLFLLTPTNNIILSVEELSGLPAAYIYPYLSALARLLPVANLTRLQQEDDVIGYFGIKRRDN